MEHGTDVCPGVEGLALMVATRFVRVPVRCRTALLFGRVCITPCFVATDGHTRCIPARMTFIKHQRTALTWVRFSVSKEKK